MVTEKKRNTASKQARKDEQKMLIECECEWEREWASKLVWTSEMRENWKIESLRINT